MYVTIMGEDDSESWLTIAEAKEWARKYQEQYPGETFQIYRQIWDYDENDGNDDEPIAFIDEHGKYWRY